VSGFEGSLGPLAEEAKKGALGFDQAAGAVFIRVVAHGNSTKKWKLWRLMLRKSPIVVTAEVHILEQGRDGKGAPRPADDPDASETLAFAFH